MARMSETTSTITAWIVLRSSFAGDNHKKGNWKLSLLYSSFVAIVVVGTLERSMFPRLSPSTHGISFFLFFRPVFSSLIWLDFRFFRFLFWLLDFNYRYIKINFYIFLSYYLQDNGILELAKIKKKNTGSILFNANDKVRYVHLNCRWQKEKRRLLELLSQLGKYRFVWRAHLPPCNRLHCF